ncbi:hypothetical protein [Rubrivirga sp. IMCC43871]|uniref:hypothetical protein n=1 Tax=Rubrivirga sp. IMCC43871 TaxID=3391575 RepID=UPI00398FE300
MPILPAVQRLVDRLLYERVRPLAARMQPGRFDAVARALAVAATPLVLATSPRETRAYLRQIGVSAGPVHHLRFAYLKAVERFRGDYVYLRPHDPILKGPGLRAFEETGEAAVMVGWSAYGMIGAARLAVERGDRVVRYPYGGENGPAPDTIAPSERWAAFQAEVRTQLIQPVQIVPGGSPLAYIRALRSGQSLIILQDVPEPEAPRRRLAGTERPLPVGAVRLAKAARVPIYAIDTSFRGGLLHIELDGPLDMDEQALLDRFSNKIREQPWAWTLWREFTGA